MSLTKYGITFHSNFKLLPSRFCAISLFGHVFLRMDGKYLETYLNSEKGKELANHESWHLLQAESFMPCDNKFGKFVGYIAFYLIYILYWIRNLFIYGFSHEAYRNIPFEKEAYANEDKFDGENRRTRWKDYI